MIAMTDGTIELDLAKQLPKDQRYYLAKDLSNNRGLVLLREGDELNQNRASIIVRHDLESELVSVREKPQPKKSIAYSYVTSREMFETRFDGDIFDADVQENLRDEIIQIGKKDPKRLEAIIDNAANDFSFVLTNENYVNSESLLKRAIESMALGKPTVKKIIGNLNREVKQMLSPKYKAFPEPLVQYETAKQIDGIETYPHLVNSGIWSGLIKTVINDLLEALYGEKNSMYYRSTKTDAILGGFLHDVWKVRDKRTRDLVNSDKIIPLGSPDRDYIEKHPSEGHKFLMPYDELFGTHIMAAVLLHHVNNTQKSYPYKNIKVEADDINDNAAIVSVGEKIHAISSGRRYHKEKRTMEETCSILVSEHDEICKFRERALKFEDNKKSLVKIYYEDKHFFPLFVALKILGQYDFIVKGRKQTYN